jgi:predicted DNA-binding protein
MKAEPIKTLTISLPLNFYQSLENIALEQDRSKNYLIKKAVENYLEDLYFVKKAEEILARGENTYTLEEIEKEYGLSNHPNQVSKKNPRQSRKASTKKNYRRLKK